MTSSQSCCAGIDSDDEAVATARRVAGAVALPLEMAGVTLEPGSSVGRRLLPGATGGRRHAAAPRGRGHVHGQGRPHGVAIHTAEDDGAKLTQLKLAGRLSTAIANGEIELLYQPQVRPSTGEMIGVEALARWRHPQFGLLPPTTFVPLAERSGHIMALTVRIIDDAALQLAAWQRAGLDLTMAINLSAATMLDADLPAVVESAACARASRRTGSSSRSPRAC